MYEVKLYAADIDTVLQKHSDTVYKIALARTGNKYDANDVFQEVFLRLIKHIDRISSDEHMKRWLIRVTINCCKKHFKLWKAGNIELPDLTEELTPQESDVYQAVLRLSPKYRDVIYLFYYEDFSVKQISETLSIKETTGKSQLSRGRDKLREMLEEELCYEL